MSDEMECAVEYVQPPWYKTLWWRIKDRFAKKKESNLVRHAKREFLAIGYIPLDQTQEDGPNKWIQEAVLELITVFAKQGHSGFSAPYAINTFQKLAMFEPLIPLTGEASEWNEVSEGIFQNNRCSHVFKDKNRFNGQAYDIQGKVFVEENDGGSYTGLGSHVPITFPYTPVTEYVNVTKEGVPICA